MRKEAEERVAKMIATAKERSEAAKALKTPDIRERAVKDVTRTLREIANLREKKK